MLDAEFVGAAYPVNRTGEPVAGVRAYQTLEEVPEVADLAVICLPGAHVLEAAESALAAGVRALCVISAGFAEMAARAASARTASSPSSALAAGA